MFDLMVPKSMQWANIPDISEVEPLTDADRECFKEIRAVLERHGKLHRFGLNLIHKHFDVGDDECLVETIDVEKRTLTVQPHKKAEVSTNAIETQWRLTTGDAYIICDQQCVYNSGHANRHYYRPSVEN